ncbi:lytic transglycosylase domain-containing protein [Cyanobium sp. ATX 6A2]|uniref:lytic transglycosylase domain-containing protein n=1 Tax=Cyanobium sp. ATX 6A2 TaxID=2823700 RepID=UPI0020CC5A99|nr:lytic transglycosylase domain-containing protein [Cyanobium sp. ATX 6A2]MCP9888603.1 lytic transglycosylase domain-containing protein [Cyanobium sp. ATX 6A2]
MQRLPLFLAVSCLGSAALLLGGRLLLQQRPALTPQLSNRSLERSWRLDPDPQRRREAALLLAGRGGANSQGDHTLLDAERRLLRGQGWGRDPLAALVLKREAQVAERLGDDGVAASRWQALLRRFPGDPASADALYSLGRQQPALREHLLERFAGHPAALAAALEQGPEGALHLARWGVRWPGARAQLRRRCSASQPALSAAERNQLAAGLAQLGDAAAAQSCLGDTTASPATDLALARALLLDPEREAAAEARLLALARSAPESDEALEAVRLLGEGRSAASLEAIQQLPAALRGSAPAQARLAREGGDPLRVLAVLRQWPDDPASWELQWHRARQRALEGDWGQAALVLDEPSLNGRLPVALDGRRRFWQGLARWQLGQRQQAREIWSDLLEQQPGGYYGWRAAVRLGQGDVELDPLLAPPLAPAHWHPLGSDDPNQERLWRLSQPLEAWEHWLLGQHQRANGDPVAQIHEGRLRRAVGDHWLGLGRLEQASLRLPAQDCAWARVLERELHTPAFGEQLNAAGAEAAVPATLLAAVAKQESRFSPTVRSPVGAVGLLQLMPATAEELLGRPLQVDELEQPALNASLGARYLRQLLQRWQGNPLLAVASYNAGPNAVAGWIDPRLSSEPELWVEAIPFPETRLYVKKVMGNLWSLQEPRPPACLSAPVSPG